MKEDLYSRLHDKGVAQARILRFTKSVEAGKGNLSHCQFRDLDNSKPNTISFLIIIRLSDPNICFPNDI